MDCKEVQDKLDAYMLGALEQEESRAIEDHLAGCARCREWRKQTAQALELWRELPGIEPENPYSGALIKTWQSPRKIRRFLALGAVVLLVALLCMVWPFFSYQAHYPLYHLTLLERAILQYNVQYHYFPEHDLSCLLTAGKNTTSYLPPNFKADAGGEILDPWGTPYRYRYPGIHNKFLFDIYSCGKNRLDEQGSGDDLTNWKK